MKKSPNKCIWLPIRLAKMQNGSYYDNTFVYFYGGRIEENGLTNSYGQWLSCVYSDGAMVYSSNSSNGVRPVIKLKYTTKVEKTTDSLGNTLWLIK